jgi:quercetin dioxygenase-like cupin family protein
MATIAEDRSQLGYALHENEGEAFWLLGMLQTIKIGRGDTNGAYGLVEVVVPEGIGSPWHVHPEEDEWFYVLEGEITFWVADTCLSLKAGSFAFGPKGVPHTFYAEACARARRPAAPGRPPGHGAARSDREAKRVRDPRPSRPAARPLTRPRPTLGSQRCLTPSVSDTSWAARVPTG